MPMPNPTPSAGRDTRLNGSIRPAKLNQKSGSERRKPILTVAKTQRVRCIHTVVVDTDPLIRAGLMYVLRETRFRVIASCSSLSELLQYVPCGSEGLVLVGLGKNASEVVLQVSSLKEQRDKIHVIMLSDEFRMDDLLASVESGADGYLIKSQVSSDSISKALDLVLMGATILPRGFSQEMRARASARLEVRFRRDDLGTQLELAEVQFTKRALEPRCSVGLSDKERLILEHLTRGASNKSIGRALSIAEATVKAHVKALLRKIGARNRTQAAIWAVSFQPTSAPEYAADENLPLRVAARLLGSDARQGG